MVLNFRDNRIKNAVKGNEIGIEKECLRIDSRGRLAHTPHPFPENDKNIGRDFCENQIEFISDVFTDSGELIAHLNRLHDRAYDKIQKNGELLWSFSNPPFVSGENDIPIAKFSKANKAKENYRNYLAEKYGKMKMLFSGIHYNFSLSPRIFNISGIDKDSFYLDLAQKLLSYSWLIVYLTAASPLLDDSYIKNTALDENDKYRYASVRCSEVGYWNDFIPTLNYNSIEEYSYSILRYVTAGLLKTSSELYYPVRIKPRGENSLKNLLNGANHIELRILDVNPFSRTGIAKEDIDFIHILILWLCSFKSESLSERQQIDAVKNIKTAALYDDSSNKIIINNKTLSTKAAVKLVLNSVCSFSKQFFPEFYSSVDFQLSKLNGNRYAKLAREQFGGDFSGLGLKLAEKYTKGEKVSV